MTTSGFRTEPQSTHVGSGRRATTSSRRSARPHETQLAVAIEPCTSTTSREPAR